MTHSVSPGLSAVKDDQVARLSARGAQAIMGGFHSDALGTTHVYPSSRDDQYNLAASVTRSLMADVDENWRVPFTCVAPENIDDVDWPWELHTSTQIRQAAIDGMAWITQQRATLKTLKEQVRAATTETEALAIRWPG